MFFVKQLRFDASKLQNVKKDKFGFAHFDANITRTGIFVYRKSDGGIIRELRSPDEVFSSDSIKTLQGRVITDEHPNENITSKNVKNLQVGFLSGDIKRDGIFLTSKLTLTDEDVIKKVDNGKQELSCGYEVELVFTSGEFRGEKYDAIQKNINYNHVSIVDSGRAGPDVKLRQDSSDAFLVDVINLKEDTKDMFKIKIKDKEFEVSKEAKDAFDVLQTENEAAAKKLDTENKNKIDKLTAEKEDMQKTLDSQKLKLDAADDPDKLKAKIDALEADNKEMKVKVDNFDSEIIISANKRIKLYDAAKKVCSDDVISKLDTMSIMDIKKSVIATSTKMDLSDKSEAYIDARFDYLEENIDRKDDSGFNLLASKLDATRQDAVSTAKKNYNDRLLNAHKNNKK